MRPPHEDTIIIEIVVGAQRTAKEQTRRICKLLVDGQPRGRLSLTLKEALELVGVRVQVKGPIDK